MSFSPDMPNPTPPAYIRDKVNLPGILLAVVGVLNLLIGGYLLASGIHYLRMTEQARNDEVKRIWAEMPPQVKQIYTDHGIGEKELTEGLAVAGPPLSIYGALSILIGLLGLFGGMRMAKMRSYGLALTGAILTAIPCVSPCCIGGQIVGVWAMVVLMSGDVQAAFRGNPPPQEYGAPPGF
jgi:hypothetical protein